MASVIRRFIMIMLYAQSTTRMYDMMLKGYACCTFYNDTQWHTCTLEVFLSRLQASVLDISP